MRTPRGAFLLALVTTIPGLALSVSGGDWTNAGGNQGRNGLSSELGPDSATDVLWTGGRSSMIAWQPVIAGRRVFVVRQSQFMPEQTGSPVVCMDLDDGHEVWFKTIPANQGDWTTWLAGVSHGRVFVSRSGNGATVSAKLWALDAASGNHLWPTGSQDLIDAGPYDGVVFADDGDPVVASFRTIKRINAEDGTTVWTAARVGSVSGNCGGAIHNGAVYVADAVVGGHAIKKFDLVTGAFLYQSPVMAGFTIQNTPMVSPDGTIYLSRVQNNAGVDYFYAINDNGSQMSIRWSAPAGYSTSSEFAVGNDGSVYMWGPVVQNAAFIERRAAADGALISQTEARIPADFAAPRLAVDRDGRVYFSNGAFSNGRLYSFNADLTQRWSIPVPNINIGAPALGEGGTLVVAGVGTNIFALRTDRPPACGTADYNGDGDIGTDQDIEAFFACLGGSCCATCFEGGSDFNADGDAGTDQDIESFFRVLGGGPC
ncbi:MAG TPA: PQQ-binding-like beta-propeller repeat protein [Phycisphaerales bacterium]|nr:PQQ-binding-like beta-propeller repeat protein [Phycisphaerales bacterium]